MRIGFARLKRMGGRMVANLAGAGHEMTLWNLSADKAVDLATDIGARVAGTTRALADGAAVVVTMLADDAASDAAHRGPDGMLAASGGARWIFEMGTMSQRHIAALRVDAPDGVDVIDAPVSGATQAAEEAELMIMVGAAPVTALVPVFDAIRRRTM